jgi:uncharacterized protein (TIGR03067 family)
MQYVAKFAWFFGMTIGIATAGEPAAPLDGTYSAIAVIREGKPGPDELVKTVSLKIAGDDLTFTVKDKTFPAKIKLNAKMSPTAIDIAPSEGMDKGRTFLGIVKLEKGELHLAYRERGDRPTDFKGQDGAFAFRLKLDEKH